MRSQSLKVWLLIRVVFRHPPSSNVANAWPSWSCHSSGSEQRRASVATGAASSSPSPADAASSALISLSLRSYTFAPTATPAAFYAPTRFCFFWRYAAPPSRPPRRPVRPRPRHSSTWTWPSPHPHNTTGRSSRCRDSPNWRKPAPRRSRASAGVGALHRVYVVLGFQPLTSSTRTESSSLKRLIPRFPGT